MTSFFGKVLPNWGANHRLAPKSAVIARLSGRCLPLLRVSEHDAAFRAAGQFPPGYIERTNILRPSFSCYLPRMATAHGTEDSSICASNDPSDIWI